MHALSSMNELFPLLLMLSSLGGSLPMGIPPEGHDEMLARIAPEECVVYMSWEGMATPDPNSSNRTEALLAEEEVHMLIAALDEMMEAMIAYERPIYDESWTEEAPARHWDEQEAEEHGHAHEGNGEELIPHHGHSHDDDDSDDGLEFDDAIFDESHPGTAYQNAPSGENRWREQLPELIRMLLTRPTALYISDIQPEGPFPIIQGGVAVNLGIKTDWQKEAVLVLVRSQFQGEVAQIEIEGEEYYRVELMPESPLTWGIHEGYLLMGIGEGSVETMLANMRTEQPNWLTEIDEKLPVERRGSLVYANAETILELVKPLIEIDDIDIILESIGLGNVRSYAAVGGLNEESYVQKNSLFFDGFPRGIFAAMDGDSLSIEELESIPADALLASAFRLDVEILLDSIMEITREIDEREFDRALQRLEAWEEDWQIDLFADILGPLGDSWNYYISPSENVSLLTGITLVVPLRDAEHMEQTITHLKNQMAQRAAEFIPNPNHFGPFGQTPAYIETVEWNEHEIHILHFGTDFFFYTPCMCIVEDQLVVTLFPQNIKALLNRGDDFESLADSEWLDDWFGTHDGPITFSYLDERELLHRLYPWVQVGGQMRVGEVHRDIPGMALDMSALPQLSVFNRHFDAVISASYRLPDSIETVTQQTLPGGGVIAMAPIYFSALRSSGRYQEVEAVEVWPVEDDPIFEGEGPIGEDPFDEEPFGDAPSDEEPFSEKPYDENPSGEAAIDETPEPPLEIDPFEVDPNRPRHNPLRED